MTEANFGKLAIPAEGDIRSTLDIQKASTVSVNKYMCTHIHVYVCIHAYVFIFIHTHVHTHIHTYTHVYILYGVGGEKECGGTKLYGKMNGRYKKVH